ncbi:hypothetical protein [Cronobacter malonaticus]|uniref:hypothetical protein n=2 Tax=Cronobacter malonaticus TaxID=413503 RepID=UPI0018F8864B|nr:hypothetical protein [Cronobacter malonaticus]EMA8651640.1 hypothetical protein [Cronobacter sakazakii]MDI6467085.1 hypothetical protein [Cronobacter malonaticus]
MFTDETETKLYVRLNKETVKKLIKWEAIEAPSNFTEASEDIVDTLFLLEYKGKKLALYLRKYKYFLDEERWVWGEDPELAIVTDKLKILWNSKNSSQALRDLYETVTRQASGFNDLINDLLNE